MHAFKRALLALRLDGRGFGRMPNPAGGTPALPTINATRAQNECRMPTDRTKAELKDNAALEPLASRV